MPPIAIAVAFVALAFNPKMGVDCNPTIDVVVVLPDIFGLIYIPIGLPAYVLVPCNIKLYCRAVLPAK